MAANHKKIYRIRTGGQSGVDRAAVDFAKLCVGGPRASECSEAYDLTIEVLHSIFCHDTW